MSEPGGQDLGVYGARAQSLARGLIMHFPILYSPSSGNSHISVRHQGRRKPPHKTGTGPSSPRRAIELLRPAAARLTEAPSGSHSTIRKRTSHAMNIAARYWNSTV